MGRGVSGVGKVIRPTWADVRKGAGGRGKIIEKKHASDWKSGIIFLNFSLTIEVPGCEKYYKMIPHDHPDHHHHEGEEWVWAR